MTAEPSVQETRGVDPADVPRLVGLLESDFGAASPPAGQLANQFLLDALDRGEYERFVVWPAHRPAGLLYLGHAGTVIPAGSPAAGPPLAAAAERASWRVLVGDAAIASTLVDAAGRGLLRRRPSVREQRFMVAGTHGDREPPAGLRAAGLGDLEVLTDYACALHVEDRMGPPISRGGRVGVRARLRDSILGGATWVVERVGRPVAKVDVSLRSQRRGAQVAGVYVAPEWRGRGIGGAAVGAVTDLLLAEGMPGITLHVRSDNAAAIRAYARAGYGDRGAWLLALR